MERHITSIEIIRDNVDNTDDLTIDDIKHILNASKYYYRNSHESLKRVLMQMCPLFYPGIIPKMNHLLAHGDLNGYNANDIINFHAICDDDASLLSRLRTSRIDVPLSNLSQRPRSSGRSSSGRSSSENSSKRTYKIGGSKIKQRIRRKTTRKYKK